MPAPPPIRKPGRVTAYSVVADIEPAASGELELHDGDTVFIEDSATGDFLTARVGQRTCRVPRELLQSESISVIEHPLHDAAKRGNLELVRAFLANGVGVNGLDRSGATALHWAAFGGHVPVVEELLRVSNICIAAQNKMGDTPLHAASRRGHLACLQILVVPPEGQAAVHTRNNDGKRPADVAATPEVDAFLRVTMRSVAETVADLDNYEVDSDAEADAEVAV